MKDGVLFGFVILQDLPSDNNKAKFPRLLKQAVDAGSVLVQVPTPTGRVCGARRGLRIDCVSVWEPVMHTLCIPGRASAYSLHARLGL